MVAAGAFDAPENDLYVGKVTCCYVSLEGDLLERLAIHAYGGT